MSATLALDNLRSLHNVGTLMRSAYVFGFDGVVTIGITPHPRTPDDQRLPHAIDRAEQAIRKTALGGEKLFRSHFDNTETFLAWVKKTKSHLAAVEISTSSSDIKAVARYDEIVVVLGSEVQGVSPEIQRAAAQILEIPTADHKQSLNVAAAGAIAMYEVARANAIL